MVLELREAGPEQIEVLWTANFEGNSYPLTS